MHYELIKLILEAKAEIGEKVADITNGCIVGTFEESVPVVPLRVQVKMQDTWG